MTPTYEVLIRSFKQAARISLIICLQKVNSKQNLYSMFTFLAWCNDSFKLLTK